MITLGIETSCDETSIALLDDEKILINSIYSQTEHGRFGGVVPEVASRAHLEKIDVLAYACFEKTGIAPGDIDLIGVTDSPGLAGALLVGISYALGLHTALDTPITGVNHLKGHIYSAFLEHDIEYPTLALVVSGGHTSLYRMAKADEYELLGETVDDAAGEAFDKVGKLLGFSYPAGRSIEEEAARFDGDVRELPQFPEARCSQGELHFSFSGLKTAVKYYLTNKKKDEIELLRPAICRAFQTTVVNTLVNKASLAARTTGINRIALVGGVACNGFLRESLRSRFPGTVYAPSPALCTDNAAMIALAARRQFLLGNTRAPKMSPSGTL